MLFRKPRTLIIDLETLADPRIARFLEFGLVTGRFLLPEPPAGTTEEEQHLADRARETITRLKKIKGVSVKLDAKLTDQDVLITALRRNKATLLTANADLKAACDGLPAVSTADIYALFKPAYLSGNVLRLRVTKRGKEKSEGLGYLEGGVKVVVENGAGFLGREIEVVVQGALETEVGQVVFARPRFAEVK